MSAIRDILFVERSPTRSMHAVESVAALARLVGARVSVGGYVGSHSPGFGERWLRDDTSRSTTWWADRVETLREHLTEAGIEADTVLLGGDVCEALNRRADKHGHDLIVVVRERSHAPWVRRPSAADRELMREAEVPVLFLTARSAPSFGRAVAGVDLRPGSAGSMDEAVIRQAASFAASTDGELELVHAWTLIGDSILASPRRGLSRSKLVMARSAERRRKLAIARGLLRAVGQPLNLPVYLPYGSAGRALERHIDRVGADIVFLGPPRLSGMEALFLGSLAEYLLANTDAAVMVVPSSDEPAETPLAESSSAFIDSVP